MTEQQLKVQIAHAKWDVEYWERKAEETNSHNASRGLLDNAIGSISGGLFGKPPMDGGIESSELANAQQKLAGLTDLADDYGIDVEDIPARSHNEYTGDL